MWHNALSIQLAQLATARQSCRHETRSFRTPDSFIVFRANADFRTAHRVASAVSARSCVKRLSFIKALPTLLVFPSCQASKPTTKPDSWTKPLETKTPQYPDRASWWSAQATPLQKEELLTKPVDKLLTVSQVGKFVHVPCDRDFPAPARYGTGVSYWSTFQWVVTRHKPSNFIDRTLSDTVKGVSNIRILLHRGYEFYCPSREALPRNLKLAYYDADSNYAGV